MKIKITEITDWERCEAEIGSALSHDTMSNVYAELAKEERIKNEERTWHKGLPFEYEAATAEESEAVDEAIQAYAEQHCEFELLKPIGCEYEIVEA